MTRRIFWAIFSASFLIFLLGAVFCVYFLQKEFEKNLLLSMRNQAYSIKTILDSTSTKISEIKIPERLSVIEDDGEVVFDSVLQGVLESHSNRPEIIDAIKKGEGVSKRFSANLHQKTFYYALKLKDGKILRIASNRDNFVKIFLDSIFWWIGLFIFSIAVCLLLARVLSRLILSPLESLNLKNLSKSSVYEEFLPFLNKISQQEKTIQKQLKILRQKNQEFNTITQNMQECFILLDGDLKIISFNKMAKSIFKSLDHHKKLAEIFDHKEVLDTAFRALTSKRCECDVSIDGAHYQILASGILDEEGGRKKSFKPRGVILFILDITEKKERENLRREFSANVSHELKTPLTSISGYAELLKNNLVQAGDVSEFGRKIESQAKRLLELINDIMKLSELDESKSDENIKERIDLFKSVQNILEQLPTGGLQVDVKGHGEVYGVKTLIEDMIFNLCENAIKYNKKNGSIEIIITENSLSIQDSGIGISKENQKRVFERFFREDKSHSKRIEGTGLGLSIVKHIANLHQFDIKLKSKVGKGTKITISWKNEKGF